ncbi:hypothetical protein KI387_038909, partial [Taxus chinensis]
AYAYGGSTYKASGAPTGADFKVCHKVIYNALNHDQACTHMKCTFGGIWNGGGGDGQKKLFVASFFFDRAAEVTISSQSFIFKTEKLLSHLRCMLELEHTYSRMPMTGFIGISYMCDVPFQAGFVDPSAAVAKVKPEDFKKAAKKACGTNYENAGKMYPDVDKTQLPYLCMDLAYQYSLLTDGFDLSPMQEITLVKQVKYKNSLVEAAWPL